MKTDKEIEKLIKFIQKCNQDKNFRRKVYGKVRILNPVYKFYFFFSITENGSSVPTIS
jgi:hypothetical protein